MAVINKQIAFSSLFYQSNCLHTHTHIHTCFWNVPKLLSVPGAGSTCSRWTTICLGLLCLLLLVVATGLCVIYVIQKNQLQTERDQSLTSDFNLSQQRNNLQTEKDQLLFGNSNLTV